MFASKDTLLTRPSGYNIARSVRLRSSASAYFSRTFSTGNRKTFTFSAWVKKAVVGNSTAAVLLCSTDNSTSTGWLHFNTGAIGSTDALTFQDQLSSTELVTTQLFRDPSAWYHIILAVDTTQATASNRAKLYVNGTQVTSFSTATYPTQNADTNFNRPSTFSHTIGTQVAGSRYFDGYLTEINFVDGQALTPSSFGETDSITGVWKPKKYGGTYGTNGFYLNFSDNSNNTAATIGKDYSGNGNNWTPNNISVTAGATYDSMQDVPTLTSLTAANYAVSNVLDIDRANITTSNGNLTLTKATANDSPRAAATFGATSGKFYAEITWTSITNTTPNDNYIITGVITKENWTDSSNGYNAVLYLAANNGLPANGQKGIWTAGSFAASSYGSGYFVAGSVIGIALNLDAGTVTFYLNNVSQGAITLPTTAQPWFFYNTSDGTGNGYTANWNFGQRPFTYTPPTGYVALNTYNLPASTITNGAAYMAATTYTGTGSSLTVANTVGSTSFQPDWVWVKGRSGATDHALYDSVRGVQKQLESNQAGAETTETTGLTAFGSTGFTVGALAQMNTSSATYVGWQWKAGGTAVSNTDGTITTTVSASPSAGFSVMTYTGTGIDNKTIGHGLGAAPKFLIWKPRASTTDWMVWHTGLSGFNYDVRLNTTAGQGTGANPLNNTAPSSTVITLRNQGDVNGSGTTIVCYAFAAVAGYSAFGSYTGNGSNDGPFVYTGFRPRWVLVKNSSQANDWFLMDSSMNTYNVIGDYLHPNTSSATVTFSWIDFLSNGFKIRSTSTGLNNSSIVQIYAAFAENPFKNALAR